MRAGFTRPTLPPPLHRRMPRMERRAVCTTFEPRTLGRGCSLRSGADEPHSRPTLRRGDEVSLGDRLYLKGRRPHRHLVCELHPLGDLAADCPILGVFTLRWPLRQLLRPTPSRESTFRRTAVSSALRAFPQFDGVATAASCSGVVTSHALLRDSQPPAHTEGRDLIISG